MYTQAMKIVTNFKHSTGPSKLVLPMKDEELISRQDKFNFVYIFMM